MYAKDMSEEFKGLAPMHSFFSALASDTRPPPGIGKTRVDMETLKKFALLKHGEIVDLHSVEADIREIEVADLVESPGAVRLAKIAGGDWTRVQWANAVSVTTFRMTGDELLSLFIPSWVK